MGSINNEGYTSVELERFPPRIRAVEVVAIQSISATMRRITFGGEGAADFYTNYFDDHVKIVFPEPETGEVRLPTPGEGRLDWPRPFPTNREYTIRAHRPEIPEFDIDFVVHEGGIASTAALEAKIGDTWHIAGPAGGRKLTASYEHYVLIADETALPAVARWVEEHPYANADLIITVDRKESILNLGEPDGMRVQWVIRDFSDQDQLLRLAQDLELPEHGVFVWLAGETGQVKSLRPWIRKELGLGKEHSAITGYWKHGVADTHEHLD